MDFAEYSHGCFGAYLINSVNDDAEVFLSEDTLSISFLDKFLNTRHLASGINRLDALGHRVYLGFPIDIVQGVNLAIRV